MVFDHVCRRAIFVMLCFVEGGHALTLESSQGMSFGKTALAMSVRASRAGARMPAVRSAMMHAHGDALLQRTVPAVQVLLRRAEEVETCPNWNQLSKGISLVTQDVVSGVTAAGTAAGDIMVQYKDYLKEKMKDAQFDPLIDEYGEHVIWDEDYNEKLLYTPENLRAVAEAGKPMVPLVLLGMSLSPTYGTAAKAINIMMASYGLVNKQINANPDTDLSERASLVAKSMVDVLAHHSNTCIGTSANWISGTLSIGEVWTDTSGKYVDQVKHELTPEGELKLELAVSKIFFASVGGYRAIKKSLDKGTLTHDITDMRFLAGKDILKGVGDTSSKISSHLGEGEYENAVEIAIRAGGAFMSEVLKTDGLIKVSKALFNEALKRNKGAPLTLERAGIKLPDDTDPEALAMYEELQRYAP